MVRMRCFVVVGLVGALTACGGGGANQTESVNPAPPPPVSAPEPQPAPAPSPAPDEYSTPGVGESDTADEGPVTEAVLRMAIHDATTSGIPERFEVWIRGTGSWFYSQDWLQEEAGPFPTGETSSFFIYPEGRDTPEIEVELVVPPDVKPGSVLDLVSIEVYDDKILVIGTSVPGFEATFER